MELEDIILKLLGNLRAYGATEIDNEALRNLEEVPKIINCLTSILYENAKLIDRPEASIQQIAEKSYLYLKEIKDGLNIHLEEIQEIIDGE